MAENLASFHSRIYDEEKSARASLEAYWQTLMYNFLPRKAYITRIKSTGDRLPIDLYDSTPIVANSYFAAGMQSYMSGPQTKWFTVGLRNRKLMTNRVNLNYLRDTEDVLYSIINGSNFYQEDVESYLGLGVIGTDIMYAEEDIKEDVRFDCLNIENVIIVNDAQGRTNMAYIEYEYSAYQAYGKFGNKVSVKTMECFKKGDYQTKFKYLFCVFPREVYDQSKKDARNMPFDVLWIDRDDKSIVRESGYKEFPFMVSRFAKGKGSPYGYSPAMNVLPDAQMLQEMGKSNILAAQNASRPPLEIPDEVFLKPYNFNPGGRNIRNAGFPNEHITPIITGANLPLSIEFIKYQQLRIGQAFYNDLFILTEQTGDMTAFEVNVRNNQRMQLLGSAIGNIMREKLSPVIDRVYAIAARLGKLPPLPMELANEEYVIEYISPLARAQKSLELNNLQQAMSVIASFGQVNPEIFDKINWDELVDYTADITNIAPQLIKDDDEVMAIRDGRAQQQELAMQMEMMKAGTDTIKAGTEADKNIADAQAVGVK